MKRSIVIVVFLCLVTSVLAQKTKKKEQEMEPMDVTELSETDALKVETLLIEAEKELILENYFKAYDLYKRALEISPKNPTLNFKMAEVLSKNGDNTAALSYAVQAMEIDPTNKYYLLLAAEIHKSVGNYSDAARIYQQLIDTIEGTESYLFDLAIIYQYLGDNQKALATYRRAEEIFGMNEFVLKEKQKIYLQNSDFESLIADWDKLIAENPDEHRLTIELCEFLISEGKVQEAKERLKNLEGNAYADLIRSEIALGEGNLQEALRLAQATFEAPSVDMKAKLQLLSSFLGFAITEADIQTIKALALQLADQYADRYEVMAFTGDVMYRMQDESAAREFYLRAVQINPANSNVWQNILNIDASLNDYQGVIAHAEKALEYFPNQAVFYYFAGTGYLVEKNYKRSVQVLNQGIKYVTDPSLTTIFYGQLGDAYNSLKDHTKSFASYDKALEANPDNDHVLNNYSYFLSLRNENMERALEMSTKLVKMHPDNPTYLDTHGWVLYVLKDFKQAAVFLEKAASMEEDGTVIEHYGDALYQLGRVDEAVEQWKKASQMSDASDKIQKKIADRKLYE